MADTSVKSYIKSGLINSTTIQSSVSDGYTYIGDHKEFFVNLSTRKAMGYYSDKETNGCCGYVAAGIVLLYYDYFYDDDFIDNETYLNASGNAFEGEEFAKYLYEDIGKGELNYDNSLNATQAAKVMKEYLSIDCNITMTYWSVNMPTKSAVVSQLKKDRPVIYCDRWDNPKSEGDTVDHAVVVYGYDDDNNLVAHFGWANYTHVECSSPALALFISSASTITSYS